MGFSPLSLAQPYFLSANDSKPIPGGAAADNDPARDESISPRAMIEQIELGALKQLKQNPLLLDLFNSWTLFLH